MNLDKEFTLFSPIQNLGYILLLLHHLSLSPKWFKIKYISVFPICRQMVLLQNLQTCEQY